MIRKKDRTIKSYITHVNGKDKPLDPTTLIHFKFTNVRQEVWGRGIFHALLTEFKNEKTGERFEAPIFAMKRIEDNIMKITDNHASPIRMIYFEDAGENFIKKQGEKLKHAKQVFSFLT